MGSIDDISQLCRLCLVKDQVNIPIFDGTSDIGQTFIKIESCLPVKVSRNDNLPKKICDGCSYKLDMLYTFRNTSIDSEKQLIQWLNQAGLSTISQTTTVKDPLASTTKPEIMVKQENFDTTDSRVDGDNPDLVDPQSFMIQQDHLGYEQEFVDFGEASGSNANDDSLTDEPAPKRAKRAAALKKAPLDDETEDDLDAAMQITKAEEEDEEEVDQPEYVEAPSTSADDQPGPSGVGKATTEAPKLACLDRIKKYPYVPPLDVRREANQHREPQKWLCPSCPLDFLSVFDLDNHCVQDHSLPKLQCPLCTNHYTSYFDLEKHFKQHWNYCNICKKDLKTRSRWQMHRQHHFFKPGLSCCGRLYNSDSNLQKHIDASHRKEFICEICGNTFKTKKSYESHVDVHTNGYIKRYECEICQRKFRRSNGLVYHMDSIHGLEKYVCDFCKKVFRSKRKHQEHLKIHIEGKLFVCNICDKSFARNWTLKDHLRVHTNEKPFNCKFCNKGFSQRSAMNLHIRGVHKEEKLLQCTICEKRFLTDHSLGLHINLHSQKKYIRTRI